MRTQPLTRVSTRAYAQENTPPNLMKQAAGLQGNFDVSILKAGASTPEQVEAAGVCV